jgi:hypothetical protein
MVDLRPAQVYHNARGLPAKWRAVDLGLQPSLIARFVRSPRVEAQRSRRGLTYQVAGSKLARVPHKERKQ